jgi:hypothetical protein
MPLAAKPIVEPRARAEPAMLSAGRTVIPRSAPAAAMLMCNHIRTNDGGANVYDLVELFPTRIRYSGLSLPHHIGNGWFRGFLPATAFAIVRQHGTSIRVSGIRSAWRQPVSSWA